jgi:hypothetical protein
VVGVQAWEVNSSWAVFSGEVIVVGGRADYLEYAFAIAGVENNGSLPPTEFGKTVE